MPFDQRPTHLGGGGEAGRIRRALGGGGETRRNLCNSSAERDSAAYSMLPREIFIAQALVQRHSLGEEEPASAV